MVKNHTKFDLALGGLLIGMVLFCSIPGNVTESINPISDSKDSTDIMPEDSQTITDVVSFNTDADYAAITSVPISGVFRLYPDVGGHKNVAKFDPALADTSTILPFGSLSQQSAITYEWWHWSSDMHHWREQIHFAGADDGYGYLFFSGGGSVGYYDSSTNFYFTTVSIETWHHYRLVVSGSQFSLYIDGTGYGPYSMGKSGSGHFKVWHWDTTHSPATDISYWDGFDKSTSIGYYTNRNYEQMVTFSADTVNNYITSITTTGDVRTHQYNVNEKVAQCNPYYGNAVMYPFGTTIESNDVADFEWWHWSRDLYHWREQVYFLSSGNGYLYLSWNGNVGYYDSSYGYDAIAHVNPEQWNHFRVKNNQGNSFSLWVNFNFIGQYTCSASITNEFRVIHWQNNGYTPLCDISYWDDFDSSIRNGYYVNRNALDSDNDGLLNFIETHVFASNPNSATSPFDFTFQSDAINSHPSGWSVYERSVWPYTYGYNVDVVTDPIRGGSNKVVKLSDDRTDDSLLAYPTVVARISKSFSSFGPTLGMFSFYLGYSSSTGEQLNANIYLSNNFYFKIWENFIQFEYRDMQSPLFTSWQNFYQIQPNQIYKIDVLLDNNNELWFWVDGVPHKLPVPLAQYPSGGYTYYPIIPTGAFGEFRIDLLGDAGDQVSMYVDNLSFGPATYGCDYAIQNGYVPIIDSRVFKPSFPSNINVKGLGEGTYTQSTTVSFEGSIEIPLVQKTTLCPIELKLEVSGTYVSSVSRAAWGGGAEPSMTEDGIVFQKYYGSLYVYSFKFAGESAANVVTRAVIAINPAFPCNTFYYRVSDFENEYHLAAPNCRADIPPPHTLARSATVYPGMEDFFGDTYAQGNSRSVGVKTSFAINGWKISVKSSTAWGTSESLKVGMYIKNNGGTTFNYNSYFVLTNDPVMDRCIGLYAQ